MKDEFKNNSFHLLREGNVCFQNCLIYIYKSGLLRQEAKERKEWGRGDAGRFSIAFFRRFDGETTSNHDEILDGDSLQCDEHFY